jgi:ribulose-5-phosphate 4-epimerase/fuculose-1-phosphate aldolase
MHSHALSVVPFTISTQPLAACFHLAGFLGSGVPVWDFDTVYSDTDHQDMLVRNVKLGASLAKCFDHDSNVVALLHGHGMVVVADSIEMCVLRAIYTVQNAQILQASRGLGSDVKLLSKKEAEDTANVTGMGAVKPWPLWKREVEAIGLYQNLA